MVTINHKPEKHFYNNYEVEASSIQSVLDEMIPRIRPQSQSFYKKFIAEELLKKGRTIIDLHAGNGSAYVIKLKK